MGERGLAKPVSKRSHPHPGWIKRIIFRWCFALALLSFGALVACAVRKPEVLSVELVIAWIGGTMGFLFAVQKQDAEELELFDRVFERFNKRYDDLNCGLNALLILSDVPTGKDRDTLFDYFNLCGEEYLYYSRGYIYPQVWEAWKAGMRVFHANAYIAAFWAAELDNKSYYGLTIEEICADRR